MNKKQLDNQIFLYYNNEMVNQLPLIFDLNNKISNENVWEISNSKNINNTDITNNKKIFYLYKMCSSLGNEKRKLKEYLNQFIFPFIMDFIESLLLNKSHIKTWTISQNLNDLNFYSDKSRDNTENTHTILVFLNEDYVGGEIQFKDRLGNELISFKTGDVLIYPSNEEYLHKAMPVTSGTQYVAITYL
jgi:hypothetical protein